jgi:hypothetical protein
MGFHQIRGHKKTAPGEEPETVFHLLPSAQKIASPKIPFALAKHAAYFAREYW